MPTLNLEQIQQRLPHRAPMLLVDEVLDYEADKTLTAQRHFTEGDRVFEGHFPGHPILPGMLGVESLAQAAGLLVCLSRDVLADDILFYFMGCEDVRFRLPIRPGMTLRQEVRQVSRKGDIYKFEGVGLVDGKPALQATFMAKMVMKKDIA